MGFVKEFKEFAVRGNLVDTAIAFVMGAAFGKIVSAFVEGMVAPLIGLLTGGVDFSKMAWVVKQGSAEVKDAAGNMVTPAVAGVSVKYGLFITNCIDFIIVAFAVFMVIRTINRFKRKQETVPAAPPEPSSTDKLLMEIRDSLKK